MGVEGADYTAECDDGAERKVHAAGQEDKGHADGEDTVNGDLAGNVGEVRCRGETIGRHGEHAGEGNERNQDAVAVSYA